MNIEVLVRWTELKPVKANDDDHIKRLTDPNYEPTPGMVKAQVSYDYSPMVLKTEDIARYNRSNDPNFTTLRMHDGEGYVIKYPYRQFLQLMIECSGKTVLSCLPEDYVMDEDVTSTDGGSEDYIDFDEDDIDGFDNDEDDLTI